MERERALTQADIADLSRWTSVLLPGCATVTIAHAPIKATLEGILQMHDSTRRAIIRHNDWLRAHPMEVQ
jgi:hypothetical protein